MSLHFGVKPTSERVFVRVQRIDSEGRPIKTQSMNVWQVEYDTVLDVVVSALTQIAGQAEVGEEAEPVPVQRPVRGRVGRGRKA